LTRHLVLTMSDADILLVGPPLVSISLTLECWRFVDEARSWPTLNPLPADVQAVLEGTPLMEISGAIPEPRLVVHMTRP
jgi:hypothetical protein